MFKSKKQESQLNLLDIKPIRNLKWETEENGIVVLLVPKFRTGAISRWLMTKLPKPYIKVKLDERGSFVWTQCDGNTTVGDIAIKMGGAFNETPDSMYERTGKFVNQLLRDKFLLYEKATV
ncbi:MAG: PqqD family protein [Ignavibacteriae bacterium]|nr:PqqD family protein [Ignavibacteriota bacterium]